MAGAKMDVATLAVDRFDDPFELAMELVDSDFKFCDGLASKICEFVLGAMQMLAADELILVELPVNKLRALQKSQSDIKREIVHACTDGRISSSQACTLIELLCLEAA